MPNFHRTTPPAPSGVLGLIPGAGPGSADAPLPTASAGDLRALLDGLAKLGHEVPSLPAAAGLKPADLEDPDARLSCAVYGSILGAAQARRFTPNLALRLAAETPLGAFPLLDYLVTTSDDVLAGLKNLVRYFRIVSNPMTLDLRDERDGFRLVMVGPGNSFGVEFTASLAVFHLRRETDGKFKAERLSLSHRPDDAAEFERMVGCPVDTEAVWSGLALSNETAALPPAVAIRSCGSCLSGSPRPLPHVIEAKGSSFER